MHDVPYFDRFASVYDFLMPAANASDIAPGLTVAKRPVERILDVGGGTGRVARALSQSDVGTPPVVVDASEGMLHKARSHNLPVLRADVSTLPLPDTSVDAVLIVDALHHFPDGHDAISEVARILRPGGVLVVRDFDPNTVRGRMLVAAEHTIGFESVFFSPNSLTNAVSHSGLDSDIIEDGFTYTVVGVKPALDSTPDNSP